MSQPAMLVTFSEEKEWDYDLFHAIDLASGYFLSRVKTNAVITISQVVQGIDKQLEGERLSCVHLKKRRGKIIEFIGKIGAGNDPKSYRVIGCWNTTDKKYHFDPPRCRIWIVN